MENVPLWEDLLIIVAIILLWPAAFKFSPIISNILMFLSFILVCFILVRRIKRWKLLKKNGNKTE